MIERKSFPHALKSAYCMPSAHSHMFTKWFSMLRARYLVLFDFVENERGRSPNLQNLCIGKVGGKAPVPPGQISTVSCCQVIARVPRGTKVTIIETKSMSVA